MIHSEIVKSGKYYFKITRNIETYRHMIWVHTYKIGANVVDCDFPDCINISYIYENNKPMKVKIPHLLYEPECAVGTTLETGGGTEIMIKTAIRYAYNDVRTLPNFEFEDNSHIDCIEKDLSKSKAIPRKISKPLNLAYFYIAYHGMTWYEARFNAEMIDNKKYLKYRDSLIFLTDPSKKLSYEKFFSIIASALHDIEIIKYLEKLYNNTNTYREFFESIPKSKRCDILYTWLNTFMENYIGSVFSVKEWFINVNTMDIPKNTIGGSLKKAAHYKIFSYKNIQSF